ncbi:phage major capsid protein [Nocardioides KLBMP 9356]|uniref:Phage major capsid protein n=1 Tax=Nocardioides potassii TaxID=2911371 RepID=A0ABS9H6Q0_9ACTN|nr:phage major capsid protein [Nocardioides potassii]MCF6376905.1 phage major capsid protein [Nocardioides potassii]
MTFPALKEAQQKLAAKQDDLGKIFAEAGENLDLTKVTSIDGDTKAKAEQIRAMNDELSDLGSEVDRLKAVANAAEASAERAAERGEHEGERDVTERNRAKSFGEGFVKSSAFTEKGQEATIEIDLKTLLDTSGYVPETTRTGRVVDFATRPIQVLDLIPQTTTTQAGVTYMEETTFTNNAAEIAEAGTYPESALGLTEKTSMVRKVGTWLPVTDETLEDVPRARQYIDNRLPFMVRQRLDSQVLVGNGTAPNLRGVLNVAGIQTQAKGADPVPDAVYKAIVKVRTVGWAMPDAYVTNPTDWQDVRLLRTADGIYIWGNPSEPGPEKIWGLQVAQAAGLTVDTGVVGDFGNFSELAVKRGIETKISDSHSTFFVEGKQAIRADVRAAFIVYRPAAFCTVTGI